MELVPDHAPHHLTVRQFREITGASRALAYRLVRSGQLRAIRLGDRGGIRIPRAEAERFLRSRLLDACAHTPAPWAEIGPATAFEPRSCRQRERYQRLLLTRRTQLQGRIQATGGFTGLIRPAQRHLSAELEVVDHLINALFSRGQP